MASLSDEAGRERGMNKEKICPIDCKTWKITSVTVRTTANFTSQKVSTTETFKPPLYCPMCGRLIKIGDTKNEK